MKTKVIVLFFACFNFACTTQEILDFPDPTPLPTHWGQKSTSRIAGTNCPFISGEYSEPPEIYEIDKTGQKSIKADWGSYYGHIPFHLADRVEHESNKFGLSEKRILMTQSDEASFTMAFLTHRKTLVEYIFKSKEGDYQCNGGYIKFPDFSSYGMIEGMSVNFQIRNILLTDETGSLIIQTTRGPYRKYLRKTKNTFTDELFRYELVQ